MGNIQKRVVILILTVVLVLPVFFTTSVAIFGAPERVEAGTAPRKNPLDQLERWFYYRGMRACFSIGPDFSNVPGRDNGSRTRDEIMDGHWLPGGAGQTKVGFGYLAPDMDGADDNDGTVSCTDGSIFVRGAKLFGFGDPVELMCAMNRGMDAIGDGGRITPSDPLDCEKSEKFEFDGGDSSKWQRALTWALENEGDKARPKFNLNDNANPGEYTNKVLLYLIGKHSLETFCGGGRSMESAVASRTTKQIEDSKELVSVRVIIDGKVSDKHAYPLANPDRDENSKVDDVYYNQGGDDNNAKDITCKEMAQMTRDNLADYESWAKANPELVNDNAAKTDGAGLESEAKDDECLEGASNFNPLSWLGCAVLNALDTALTWLDNAIRNLLFIEPAILNDLEKSWTVFRNLAYIILLPMMMFMVIGTAINMGPFDPYTVKKALPRMLAAIIFITLSFEICAFFINLSNLVGNGIGNLISSFAPGGDVTLDGIAGAGAVGGAATGATILYGLSGGITWAVAGSIGLVLVIGLLIGFFMLIVRQVLVVMLLVLAPLAILVWIFPGNDKMWTIWKTTFTAMLMLYPLIAILISAGKFFAQTASTANIGGGGAPTTIIAMIAYVAPFFLIPATFKYGLGVFGNLAGMVNDRSRGFFDRQRKMRENSRSRAKLAAREGNRFANGTDSNWRGRLNRGISNSVNAPGAIMESGNTLTPSAWGGALRARRSTLDAQAIERNMKENAGYQTWMHNDSLNKAASESNNAQQLRDNLVRNYGYAAGSRALEDDVARVESVRQTMGSDAFRQMTTLQGIAGGTAYGTAGEISHAIARAAGNDDAAASWLISKARSASMSAGRVDYGGAGFGAALGEVNQFRDMINDNATQGDLEAEMVRSTDRLTNNVYQSQGGGTLVHSSMKASAVEQMAPAAVRTVESSSQRGDDRLFSQDLASIAATYDGLAGSAPEKARIWADSVMSHDINVSQLSPAMHAKLQAGMGVGALPSQVSIREAVEALRGDTDFLEMRREYGSAIAARSGQPAAQGQSPAQNAGGNPPNRL